MTVPSGSEEVRIVRVGGLGGLIVKARDLCTGGRSVEESCNVKVCELVPAVFGVPVIAPVVVSNPRLGGSAGVTDHVYGAVPPEPLTDAE